MDYPRSVSPAEGRSHLSKSPARVPRNSPSPAMASGGVPSGLRQRQVVPERPAGADAELGEHLRQGVLRGRPAGARALPLAAARGAAIPPYTGGRRRDGRRCGWPKAVDHPPAQSVSAVGPSLSSARDRDWIPSIHVAGLRPTPKVVPVPGCGSASRGWFGLRFSGKGSGRRPTVTLCARSCTACAVRWPLRALPQTGARHDATAYHR
jgi:hypothetical protein